ncbi:SGNH/GDSL hydrolase family protein [Saccharicrinis sp. GN24d3]|uniref:SGNH/GDSL hydrolase family protein n=1 Tax=Saccharicrinis sp. GN24d3 TaxID=3458416 RepID=UPI00403616DF
MERREFLKYMGASSVVLGLTSNLWAGGSKRCKEEVCREAWTKLCDYRIKEAAYAYVHPQKRLPNVFLYGDSISIGYTLKVREQLQGKANVFRTYRNGGATQNFIPGMEKMKKAMFQPYLKNGWDFKWDVIHFNVGLHDLKYMSKGKLDKENGKQVSSIEGYKEKLDKICTYLMKEFPTATLIFATTTPVPQGAAGRLAGDSVKYNKAALDVLAKYPSIMINDLYAFTKPNFNEWCIEPGNVHYNETGKKAQGKEVARIIAENLYN